MCEIFKFTNYHVDEIFYIRPLLNPIPKEPSLISYFLVGNDGYKLHRCICYALVNDELKIFSSSLGFKTNYLKKKLQ